MYSWEEGPYGDVDKEKLADQYLDWLEEQCGCDPDACDCLSYEEWLEKQSEPDYGDIDEEDCG